jgi:biopolymer transport protein TolR
LRGLRPVHYWTKAATSTFLPSTHLPDTNPKRSVSNLMYAVEEDRTRRLVMAMIAGGSHRGPAADMNVTPLIDVLLVLLIIFMVITPLTPTGLGARVPQPSNTPEPETIAPRTVVVQVVNAGGIPVLKINQEDVAWENLGARLVDIFKTRSERVLFVSADAALSFEDVARVIDTARAAGIDNVGLMTTIAGGA